MERNSSSSVLSGPESARFVAHANPAILASVGAFYTHGVARLFVCRSRPLVENMSPWLTTLGCAVEDQGGQNVEELKVELYRTETGSEIG